MDIDYNHGSPTPEARGDQGPTGGTARRVTVRLEPERYGLLERLAEWDGLSPTTMARMLLIRSLREAERRWDLEAFPAEGPMAEVSGFSADRSADQADDGGY